MKKLSFLAIALAVVALVGCNKEGTTVNSIALNKTEVTLSIKETVQLVATTDPQGAEVTWTSSNTAVATVNNGLVTAIAEGEAVITATAGEKTAQCQVTVGALDPYSYFNIDGFGLFGEEFEMIPGTDTTLTLSDGIDYQCQLAYIYWYGWDGDLQYITGSGWAGDGLIMNGGKVPVYIITEGEYAGYYIGTFYWTIGYEKNENDTLKPYNMIKAHMDVTTYGDWVSYVHGDSAATFDSELIWSKNYGANFTVWYTSEDFNYASYGLYFGYFNKMVYRDAVPDEGIESAFAADVDWAAIADNRSFGYAYDLEHYEETYVEGEGGEMLFTRPYDYEKVNRVFDDNDVFEEYEEYRSSKASPYYIGNPAQLYKELPISRGKSLPKDQLHVVR